MLVQHWNMSCGIIHNLHFGTRPTFLYSHLTKLWQHKTKTKSGQENSICPTALTDDFACRKCSYPVRLLLI